MKRFALVFALLVLCAAGAGRSAQADGLGCGWTARDAALLAVAGAVLLVDRNQTHELVRHGDIHETNPLLGRKPSDAMIDAYTVAAALGTVWLACRLDEPNRSLLLGLAIGIELGAVWTNAGNGLSVRFWF